MVVLDESQEKLKKQREKCSVLQTGLPWNLRRVGLSQKRVLCWPRFPNLFTEVLHTVVGLDVSSFECINGSFTNYHLS